MKTVYKTRMHMHIYFIFNGLKPAVKTRALEKNIETSEICIWLFPSFLGLFIFIWIKKGRVIIIEVWWNMIFLFVLYMTE